MNYPTDHNCWACSEPLLTTGPPLDDPSTFPPVAYGPPLPSAPAGRQAPAEHDNFWLRVAAYMIDLLVLIAGTFMVAFFLGMVAALSGAALNPGRPTSGWTTWASAALWVLISIGYGTIMEASQYRGTLGKIVVGMIVTDYEGQPLSVGEALLRNLVKWVSVSIPYTFAFLYAPFWIAALTPRKQALHDFAAKTLVVMKEPTLPSG
jgi:uncharacterized RDD family membrane protein YckC